MFKKCPLCNKYPLFAVGDKRTILSLSTKTIVPLYRDHFPLSLGMVIVERDHCILDTLPVYNDIADISHVDLGKAHSQGLHANVDDMAPVSHLHTP